MPKLPDMSDMPQRPGLTDLATKVMNLVHKTALTVSGGRLGRRVMGMDAVELHTTGRRSGESRSVMLTVPVREGDRIVLVASKGGDDRHPDWYRNLVAHPEVEITEGRATRPYVARAATNEEKAELWPRIVAAYKGYAGYQERTDRDIPVVLCDPR